MYYMKGWLRCLKKFEPAVLNLSGQDYIFKKVAMITEDTSFLTNTIYIGKLSEAVYRILSVSGITMFLINDLNIHLDKLKCGDNTVIILPKSTNRDELYAACNIFLDIQDEIIENRHRLLDAYIEDNSLPGLMNHIARIIKDPVMVLDNSFRLIAHSSERESTDLVWAESIRNGYCSFEQYYEPATENKPLFKGSELRIKNIPGEGLCLDCGALYNVMRFEGKCPKCGSRNKKIISGRDFVVRRITAEYDD